MSFKFRRKHEDIRAEIPHRRNDFRNIFLRGINVSVGNMQIPALGQVQYLCGFCGFFAADFGCSARPHFALCTLNDSDTLAFGSHLCNNATTGEFRIVGMCCQNQHIYGVFRWFCTAVNDVGLNDNRHRVGEINGRGIWVITRSTAATMT